MMADPNVGQIVVYVSETPHWPVHLPAEILGFDGDVIRLRIFVDHTGGSEWIVDARYSGEKLPGTWHWRE